MDVTAMVPGLTITAEGVGNSTGQLDASKITFNPDTFAVEVAEEQQIEANKSAAANAQTTANQGVAAAGKAQASANQAQSSANQAQTSANQAGQMAVAGTAYLRNSANVPMRRILAPAGYGATHAVATNSDPQGRDINRRVDVKVLVNKGLDQGI
jgi:hypothetical protein